MQDNQEGKFNQPWIASAKFDLTFILLPAFLATFLALYFNQQYSRMTQGIPVWVWVVFILGIDVAHVYSTLFRTYFDPEERRRYQSLLISLPALCWIAGVILYSLGAHFFWTVLAYVAVIHFVRQQYGFFMVYLRTESKVSRRSIWINKAAIYIATIYPLVYWHANLPRHFNWFVDGDFVLSVNAQFETLTLVIYVGILLLYALNELRRLIANNYLNLPKNLLLLGTVITWYVGIVYFNADIPFTITNVVSHGIPYIALIWIFGWRKWVGRNESVNTDNSFVTRIHSLRYLPIFLGILLLLAYVEESLWDGVLWREHFSILKLSGIIPPLKDPALLSLVVPLLAVPQATHYVLDAFIWKVRKPDPGFSKLLSAKESQ